MNLSPYVEALRKSLDAAAAPGGKEVTDAAALLALAIEPAARLSLIEALTDASEEITAALSDAAVETRLRGREVEFVVDEVSHPPVTPAPADPEETESSDEVARISLRLPGPLKLSIEAAAGADGISVNAWLVRALAAAVDRGSSWPGGRRKRGPGRRFTGFARA